MLHKKTILQFSKLDLTLEKSFSDNTHLFTTKLDFI